MAKRKGDQPNSGGPVGGEADKVTAQPGFGAPPPTALTSVDSPDLVPPQGEQVAPAAPVTSVTAEAPVEPPTEPESESGFEPESQSEPGFKSASKSEPEFDSEIESHPESMFESVGDAPEFTPRDSASRTSIIRFDEVRPGDTDAPSAAAAPPRKSMSRVGMLAATIVIAAAVGATAGSLATVGFGGTATSPPVAQVAAVNPDARALKDTMARLNADMVALKTAVDSSGRSANAQFTKLGDRLDRVERGQVEPTIKLAKLAEAVDRIEHRAPTPPPPAAAAAAAATTAPARDTTGSIAALAPAPLPPPQPQSQPPAAEPTKPAGPPVLEGWVLRNVYNGAALIQGRFGMVEVEPGDNLPGIGRVETIRRQDGRWVVMTSKGMIVSR